MAQEYGDHIYGPVDRSVLYDQVNHRSEQVSDQEDFVVRARRCDNLYFKDAYGQVPHRRVLLKLHHMGFYRIYKLGLFKNDMGLVTALVERWRPETNTFHFRTGEATITLQDIAVIYGLPVDGRPVIAHRQFQRFEDYAEYVFQLLGIQMTREDFKKGHRIPVRKLVEYVISVPARITDQDEELRVDQIARCWALLLLGGVMCPDSTGDVIAVLWLVLFEDINLVNTYSWGSAILAFLYRQLSAASQKDAKNIAGSVPLLEIWAWSRMIVVRPSRVPREMAPIDVNDIARAPYATRWYGPVSHTVSVGHNIRAIRDALDQMADGHFVWTPYNLNDADIAELPSECLDSNVWRASVPMIFFAIVEHHRPERVLRQFGLRQSIPPPVRYVRRVSRRGRATDNWVVKHAQEIQIWNNRLLHVVTGQSIEEGGDTTERGYDEWYDRITRRYISPTLNRRGAGHQAGSAPLLHIVDYHIREMQNAIEQIPRTSNIVDRALGKVRLSLSILSDLVTCRRSGDVYVSAHGHRRLGEAMLPQRRSRSALEEDEDVDEDEDEDEGVEVDEEEDVTPTMGDPNLTYPHPDNAGVSSSTYRRPYNAGASSLTYRRP